MTDPTPAAGGLSETERALRDERNHWIGEAKRYERLYRRADEDVVRLFKQRNDAREATEAADREVARVTAAVEALADEWETAHGDPPIDPSHISVRHATALRAALSSADTGALDRERSKAAGEALLEPWGPFEMGGFEGCTDADPEVCACATDSQPTCRNCDREIEPGEQAWSRRWPCYDTLPLDHADQDWDVISWHDDCPPYRAAAVSPEGGGA